MRPHYCHVMRKACHYSRPQYSPSFPPPAPLLNRDIFYSMPPSQSVTAPSGSKRKADLHEDCVGPNMKKSRALPTTQEASQTPVTIPSQLQEPQAGVRPLNIPPEILAIKVELNDLISFPVTPSVQFPPCAPFLSTVIAREDIAKIERRFYPYLWFPDRAPYMLKGTDYNNILCPPFVAAMKMALQRVGMDCGILALTASYQLVLFFEGGNKKAAFDAVVKKMGPGFCDSAIWQGAIGIPGQNNLVAFMGHGIQQDTQGGSGSNTSQTNTGKSVHDTEKHPQSAPRKRQNRDPFVLVGDDTAKRRRNGPPPGIPILMSVPDTPQAVSGPSTIYPTNTVFAETHTKESFPHPQNTNPAALSRPKRKYRGRASAKSRAQGQNATTATQESQPAREVAPKPNAQRGKHHQKAQDAEPSEIQAGPSGTRVPEPTAPEIQPAYSVSRQVSNNILYQVPQEDTEASGSYQVGCTGNVQGSVPLNSAVTSQTPSPFTTDQLALLAAAIPGYTQYSTSAMTNQSLVSHEMNQFGSADTFGRECYDPLNAATINQISFGSADTLGGGYYDSLNAETTDQNSQVASTDIFGGYDQLSTANTAQSSIPDTSDQTGYADPTADVSTTNQVGFPNIVTGYETGGAMTNQTSVSQPSDQVNVDATDWAQFLAAFTDEPQVLAQASYPDVSGYEQAQFGCQQVGNQDPLGQGQASPREADIAAPAPELSGHNQPQPSHMEFDANGDFNVANLTNQELFDLISSQDFVYDSAEQVFYSQPGSVPGFSGPSAGSGDFTGDGQPSNLEL